MSSSTGTGKIVIIITAPKGEGKRIARALVESRLAACVNIVQGLTSLYWWQGEIQEDQEELLIVKTRMDALNKLIDEVKKIHPYSVPEIVALPILGGNPDYLKWVDDEVRSS
ncbi:MAG: divalent-cation tolerance protein CutA [Desulfurococcales archaeon]|nr:divalent-cation tolerance protein CutA [Desulfurococcales archaeon]MCE4605687.1 divalent-cation tolerance protein CutA [Desulfurococcales archaeon]